MPTKHKNTSTTPVMYAITRYRSTAAVTASSPLIRFDPLASPLVSLAAPPGLAIQRGQVRVVGAERLVLGLLRRLGGLGRHGGPGTQRQVAGGDEPGHSRAWHRPAPAHPGLV